MPACVHCSDPLTVETPPSSPAQQADRARHPPPRAVDHLPPSCPRPAVEGGGGQAMPDGRRPEPGGWNRISLLVDDVETEVERLRAAGAHRRNDIVTGVGGRQILLDDPSGNPVELFQSTR